MSFEQELDIQSAIALYPNCFGNAPEEERALSIAKVVCNRSQRPCLIWDVADGFQSLTI